MKAERRGAMGYLHGVVFPRIRAGASLKDLDPDLAVGELDQFSPAFVRGPH